MRTAELCPRCAGRMVIKTIKGTKMLGCENWPRCNYTKRLPEAYNMEAIKAPKLPGFE